MALGGPSGIDLASITQGIQRNYVYINTIQNAADKMRANNEQLQDDVERLTESLFGFGWGRSLQE